MAEGQADEDQYVQDEEVTSIPGWAPTVNLEVKDSVETGEEEEEEVYSQRSKLFRFRDGEWKERGLGDAKLLKHKASGKVRFILRQEKTMKIVANHYVVDHALYCVLKTNQGSDKCWVWSMNDYAEEEPRVEQLALKFGSTDLATKFKEEFDKAKKLNAEAGLVLVDAGGEGQKEPPEPTALAAAPAPAAPAAPAALAKEDDQKKQEANPFAGMSLFGSNAASNGGSGGGLFAAGASAVATGGLFSSGASSGGGPWGSLSFNLGSAPSGSGGLFGGAAATTPALDAAGGDAAKQGEDEDYVAEEEVTNIPGWAPSVSLEVQDAVETGEEDEEELYSQRSKLFRFRDGDWKERGLGEAKLLRHKATKKVRFILRQEKTMKIVANHYVIKVAPYCDLRPNQGSEKCWVWTAQDFSEEEPLVENFALKFGSAELAQNFKEAFDDAKEKNSTLEGFSDLAKSAPPDDAADGDTAGGDGASAPKATAEKAAPEAAPASSGSGLFSLGAASTSASSGGGLFGGGSLFGCASSAASSSSGLFGTDAASGGSLFGGSATSGGSLFGGGAASGGSLFGGGAGSGGSAGGGASSGGASSGGLFGGGASGGGASSGGLFGGVSSGGSLFGGSAASSGGGLFGSGTAATTTNEEGGGGGGGEDDYVNEEEVTMIPGWSPSVNLEVQDSVETGEEHEEELYSQRSKLYRFRDGEWKERGLGDAKFLKHKESGKIRFMLRQEKTMKIVANHYVVDVLPYCDLQPNAGSQKCWVWIAPNFVEEELEVERLALKFGHVETAQTFKEEFDKAKVANAKVPEFAELAAGGGGEGPSAPKPTSAEKPAAAKAAPAAAPAEAKKEVPTSVPNPFAGVSLSSVTPEVSSPASSGSGLFGGASSGGSLFGSTGGSLSGLFGGGSGGSLFAGSSSASSSSASTGGLFGGGAPAAASSGGGLFGGGASATSTGGGLFGGSGGSLFGGSAASGGGLFGSAASSGGGGLFSSIAASATTSSGGGGLFSSIAASATTSSGGGLFGGSSAAAADAPKTAGGGEEDDGDFVVEEEVTTVPGWAPSVTLEVKAEVETGEEDEEELYSQRSKLLRFRDGEWKERGTGDAKILKHKKSGKIRFLLRQEKTMKIVGNFLLVDQAPYCELRPNAGSKKCWVWSALDWSEEEQVHEQFALKFASEEFAEQFKVAFDAAKAGKKAPASAAPTSKAPAVAKASAVGAVSKAAAAAGSSFTAKGSVGAASAAAAATAKSSSGAGQWNLVSESGGSWYDWTPGYGDGLDEGEDDYTFDAYLAACPEGQHEGEDGGAGGDGGGDFSSFSWMAQQQNSSGWRCGSCRLQWGEDIIECGVCEIARPGFEDQVQEKQAGKAKGQADAAAAFLGASTSSAKAPAPAFGGGPLFASGSASSSGGLFGVASGFGGEAKPGIFGATTGAASTGGGLVFGAGAASTGGGLLFGAGAASSGTPLFGGAAAGASPVFGASAAPATTAFGGGMTMGTPPPPPPPPPAPTASGVPHVVPPKFPAAAPAAVAPVPVADASAATGAAGCMDPNAMTTLLSAALASVLRTAPAAEPARAQNDDLLKRLEDEVREAREQRRRDEERARTADERARRLEEELSSMRKQMMQKQQEEARIVPTASAAASESTLQGILAVAQSALKVAEGAQQQIVQLREERRGDSGLVQDHLDAMEDRLMNRIKNWEASVEKRQESSLSSLPAGLGTAIAYSQSLHQQTTGHRLGGGGGGGGGGGVPPLSALAEGMKPSAGAATGQSSLLRWH